MPLSKVCLLNIWTAGSCGSGGVPACREKSGGCRRLVSGYAGYVVFTSLANPRFSALFYSRLFCHAVGRHSRPVNYAHALPLYCVRCCALPDPCASIAATVTSPRRCNSRSYNSRTLAGRDFFFLQTRIAIPRYFSQSYGSYFKYIVHVHVHVHVHTRTVNVCAMLMISYVILKYAPYDWLKYRGMAILVCRKKNRPRPATRGVMCDMHSARDCCSTGN